MTRSEMKEYIEEELLEFYESYIIASTRAKKHVVRAKADGILCMIEGFGMLPPSYLFTNEEYKNIDELGSFMWEPEDDT